MEEPFELLEQRVHKAAARLRELTGERDALRARLQKAEEEARSAAGRAEKAEHELQASGARGGEAPELRRRAEKAERELQALQQEREQLRQRVARMLELLQSLG